MEPMSLEEKIRDLYTVIADLRDADECGALLADLCTRKEIEKMAERIHAARLLMQGKTYQQVIAETDISSATLSRVSQCVQYGEGYRRLLQRED